MFVESMLPPLLVQMKDLKVALGAYWNIFNMETMTCIFSNRSFHFRFHHSLPHSAIILKKN